MSAQTMNKDGEWVPSIPLPHVGFFGTCYCGRRFWKTKNYRAHYALAHILKLDER